MSTLTFINLPVKNLAKTTVFFTKLGFLFDEQFIDGTRPATSSVRMA